MSKGESMISYFMKITDLKDHLAAIGESVSDKDLVIIAMNGLPRSCKSFLQSVSGRSELPRFDHLRGDCAQQECRLEAR